MKKLVCCLLFNLVNSLVFGQKVKLPSPINTPTSIEYAPSVTADGKKLIYQSDQYGIFVNAAKKVPKINAEGNEQEMVEEFETHFFGIYEVKPHPSGEWLAPKNIEPINSYANENMSPVMGGPSISYDGNILFFFANFGKNGYGREDIYFSNRIKNTWSTPENIGSTINSEGYEGFPSVSPDGRRLYFTREIVGKKAEGKQMYKIMVSERGKNGKWKMPIELPAPINTGFEKAPRIMADSKTLIFSSIKAGNKGGFDLYKSTLQKDGSWTNPEPLNFINTPKSDLFVSISPCGDKMYYVTEGDIYTTDVPLSLRPQKSAIIQGTVLDSASSQPISAKILVKDKANELIAMVDNNATDGQFTLLVPFAEEVNISINLPDYETKSINIEGNKLNFCTPVNEDIYLKKIEQKPFETAKLEDQKTLEKPVEITDLSSSTAISTSSQSKITEPKEDKIINTDTTLKTQKINKIEEVELVADDATKQTEKLEKDGIKNKEEKLITQLSLILSVVDKTNGSFIPNAIFNFKNVDGSTANLNLNSNGSEYYFSVLPNSELAIMVNALGYVPFSAKLPPITADRKVTVKLAPIPTSFLIVNITDFDTRLPIDGQVSVLFPTGEMKNFTTNNGKILVNLNKNGKTVITAKVPNHDDIIDSITVKIPENGSINYEMNLSPASNKQTITLLAFDQETGLAIKDAKFEIINEKGEKVIEFFNDNNLNIIKNEIPKLVNFTIKCTAVGYNSKTQEVTNALQNTTVQFKIIPEKKRIHELKVFVYDRLTGEEININAIVNKQNSQKSPFFISGEEGKFFDIELTGPGIENTRRSLTFNDSLINKTSTKLYVDRFLYDFDFKITNAKTKDLIDNTNLKITDTNGKSVFVNQALATLDTRQKYNITVISDGFENYLGSFEPLSNAKNGNFEPVISLSPIAKVVQSAVFGTIEKGKTIILKNIYFDQSSPVLRQESFTELDQLAKLLKENPELRIKITGHTDNAGDLNANMFLSNERCKSVIEYLVNVKTDRSRLEYEGKGPKEPISPNTDEPSRKKNRRVEFLVL